MRDESIAANRTKSGTRLKTRSGFGALQFDKNPSQKSAEGYLGTSGSSANKRGGPGFPDEPPQAQSYSATL